MGVDPLEKGKERELLDNIFKEGIIKPIWSSAVAIPKKVFNEVGGFPDGEWYMEDLETWMRIGLKFPIARCNRELATYHQNAVNRVYQVNKIKHEPIFCHTARRALEEGKVPVDLIKDFREYVAFWQYHVIGNLIFTDQKSLARKLIDETKGTELS